jgi:hypothetical protein
MSIDPGDGPRVANAATIDVSVLIDVFDAPRLGGATFGGPLAQQPHHLLAAGAIPLAWLDPGQGDCWIEYRLQGIQVSMCPGTQSALDKVVGLFMASPVVASGARSGDQRH